MKLRNYLIDLFKNFDGDKNTDFILKYPHVWKNCFDIEEQSRYHRVMIDSVLVGFDACESHYKPMIEKLESALKFYSLKSNYSLVDEGRNYDVDYKCYELNEITYGDEDLGTKAKQVLAELADFKKKMNGDEK